MSKRGLFKHKRTKSEQDWEDFVCPMTVPYPSVQGRTVTKSESSQQPSRPTHRRNGSLPRNLDMRNLDTRVQVCVGLGTWCVIGKLCTSIS